jgi:hypothetical protein
LKQRGIFLHGEIQRNEGFRRDTNHLDVHGVSNDRRWRGLHGSLTGSSKSAGAA